MRRILIVEDQADIRKLIRMTMPLKDYEIHEAEDAAGGLRIAAEVQPDLILMDVMMPGELDGLQACKRIKSDAQHIGTKVILLTARGQVKDREAGFSAGADDYLVKPFSSLQLIDTIERLVPDA